MSKEKGFQDKLKNFFKNLNKSSHAPRSRSEEYLILTEDIENELKSDNPIGVRLKAVKEINEKAKVRRLETFTTEKLWTLLEDLLKPEIPRETRHYILNLFTTLCETQPEKSGYLRAKFFQFIRTHNLDEDAGPKFEFLKALTENGRDVSYFDDKIGPFLLSWMGGLHNHSYHNNIKTGDFMIYLNSFIKFNQSFLDQEILVGLIQNICYIACASTPSQDTMECIHVLETVVCYASVPPSSLATFLATLCRTVNVEMLCSTSWKTVRHLLGTHLGHSSLLTMCQFMETADRTEEYLVIRGAVFFVGMSLWGTKIVRSLKYSPSTVLSSFQAALERKHIYISYEVMLRIQDLVKCHGDTLQSITWDLILEIIETVVDDIQGNDAWKNNKNYPLILRVVNETLDAIESIVDNGGFSGALHRFYGVIETGTSFRSETSIEKLLVYKQKNFLQCIMPNWLNHLILFTDKHYREEHRPPLKIHAIKIIQHVCLLQLQTHEEELTDKIILQYFKTLDTEPNIQVRQIGVQFLIQIVMESTSKKCHDILSILEKIVHHPYENHTGSGEALHENDAVDVSTAINGIIHLFQKKIYHLPSCIAIYCYKILVRHLSHHYKRINVLDHCGSIRYNIFNCFFRIRANSLYHLGFPFVGSGGVMSIRFSPYLAVDHRDGDRADGGGKNDGEGTSMNSNLLTSTSSSTSSLASSTNTLTNSNINVSGVGVGGIPQLQALNHSSSDGSMLNMTASCSMPSNTLTMSSCNTPAVVTAISLTLACKHVVTALKKEKDWKILELILMQIPHVLENKALILSKHGNDIDYLATALCTMVTDKSSTYPETLRHVPPRFSRSDFQAFIFPILTSLVSYHSHLEPSVQLKIVKCLELGLVTRCSRICILSLSICTLEMKETMHKLLPEVLLGLSKITAKANIAIPVLEFLSTLIHLPRIFASFVQDQYMAIFAIALPLTNPFKFNQYTVSLAHHVIAMWFLKCRLSFRRGFVSYIIKGLEANVWAPFEEETRRTDRESQNEDSSNRKRSSSLTDQTFKRKERSISGQGLVPQPHHLQHRGSRIPEITKPLLDKNLMTFHHELTETCIDLMARYAFADCSALPTRFQSTNFLLSGGHSQTWLIENKIITITTSGCTQKELRDGLCDKCWLFCRKSMNFKTETDDSPVSPTGASAYTSGSGDKAGSPENDDISMLQTESNQSVKKSLTVQMTENSNMPGSLQRRRHRSAFAGSSPGKLSRPDSLDDALSFGIDGKTKDDLHFLDNKLLDLEVGGSSDRNNLGFTSTGHGHELVKQKSEHSSCLCWCQGWAEVHIRRPTGNTSWMMRVQNQLGNHSTFEFPIKELSTMYMNTKYTVDSHNNRLRPKSQVIESAENMSANHNHGNSVQVPSATTVIPTTIAKTAPTAMIAATATSSTTLSPTQGDGLGLGLEKRKVSPQNHSLTQSQSENSVDQILNSETIKKVSSEIPSLNQNHASDSVSNNSSNHKSPPSPLSPKSPGSPCEEYGPEIPGVSASGRKNPVRRSNSSPEMCSSWKTPFMSQQREIQEQDEDETVVISMNPDPSSSPIPSTNNVSIPVSENRNQNGTMVEHVSISIGNSGVKSQSQPSDNSTSTSVTVTDTQSQIIAALNSTTLLSSANSTSSVLSLSVPDTEAKGLPAASASTPSFQCYDIPEETSHGHGNPVSSNFDKQAKLDIIAVAASEDLAPMRRDRMSTISVMTPARRNHSQGLRRMVSMESTVSRGGNNSSSGNSETGIRSGISPGFIFLQLCAQGSFGNAPRPIHLKSVDQTQKTLRVLDYIPPYETHKIGVVYVGPNQVNNETQILQNQYGSSRYREFLNGLGKLIKLSEVDPQKTFLGGLSRDGADGEFATIWQDDVMQVIFHVATLMPNRKTDPSGNAKKCHIGNDFVAIVYNNSEEEYDISTIKGQFLYACVVIEPLDHRTNRVIVKAKPILADQIGHTEPKIVSDQNLPIMARQWALHSNLASVIFQSMQRKGADLYASNWLERLRHIKRLRTRLSQESGGSLHEGEAGAGDPMGLPRRSFNVEDFTEFV